GRRWQIRALAGGGAGAYVGGALAGGSGASGSSPATEVGSGPGVISGGVGETPVAPCGLVQLQALGGVPGSGGTGGLLAARVVGSASVVPVVSAVPVVPMSGGGAVPVRGARIRGRTAMGGLQGMHSPGPSAQRVGPAR